MTNLYSAVYCNQVNFANNTFLSCLLHVLLVLGLALWWVLTSGQQAGQLKIYQCPWRQISPISLVWHKAKNGNCNRTTAVSGSGCVFAILRPSWTSTEACDEQQWWLRVPILTIKLPITVTISLLTITGTSLNHNLLDQGSFRPVNSHQTHYSTWTPFTFSIIYLSYFTCRQLYFFLYH